MSEEIVDYSEEYEKFSKLIEEYNKLEGYIEIYRKYKKLKKILKASTNNKYLEINEIKDNLTGKQMLELIDSISGGAKNE